MKVEEETESSKEEETVNQADVQYEEFVKYS